jgi:8-oxo-dGTP pyrophosphatase MutT (NUDIX family)
MLREHAAGGLVHREGKVLMVRVQNLKGDKVWTFPKGHLDQGETPEAAAVREVQEETGWLCRIVSPLFTARYFFTRSQGKVSKTVDWYLMQPEKKTGKPDANEVLAAKWVPSDEAAGLATYPSDKQLIEAFLNKGL